MRTFEDFLQHERETFKAKNADYTGDQGFDANFNRIAVWCGMYGIRASDPVGVATVYLLKQLDAFLDAYFSGRQLECESLDARLLDIGVYTKLIRMQLSNKPRVL